MKTELKFYVVNIKLDLRDFKQATTKSINKKTRNCMSVSKICVVSPFCLMYPVLMPNVKGFDRAVLFNPEYDVTVFEKSACTF